MNFNSSIVSVEWLKANIHSEHLIILDASIPKVGTLEECNLNKLHIPKSRYFDLKKKFSKQDANFPNTIPSAEQFQCEARQLGINTNSHIVIYDDLGIYSSPRAWWLFKLMGFESVAVLNGGLPAWNDSKYKTEVRSIPFWNQGNFQSNFETNLMTDFDLIQSNISRNAFKIIDARSKNRFEGTEAEPREGVRCGTIPNSFNLPSSKVIEANSFVNASTIQSLINNFVKPEDKLVFSCGSGITACILALAADVAGYKNFSVYDGSWTEYGSLIEP